MCDKEHYEDLIKRLELLEGEMSTFREDAKKSIDHFVINMEELKEIVTQHADSSQELISAWDTATGFARFVKWFAVLIASCAVIYGAFKDVLFWKIGG